MPTTRSGKSSTAAQPPPTKKRKPATTPPSPQKKTKPDEEPKTTTNTTKKGAPKETSKPPETQSRVLEKGLLYYFIRGKVGIDSPKTIDEIARGYLILRPVSTDTKLHGTLPPSATPRLVALPKKALPAGPKDRFMAFIEKSDTSYDKLREEFLKGQDYETKTAGHHHSPDATPVGEGLYVITTTGRESHLSYMATLPSKLGELQSALRFHDKGSFIMSSKNPSYKGPAFARLPRGPEYPRKVLENFGDLRWVGTQPEFLDYPGAQILLIGRKGMGKEDENGEDAVDELSRLEEEDLERMKELSGDEADVIYADLHSRKMDHPGIQKDLA